MLVLFVGTVTISAASATSKHRALRAVAPVWKRIDGSFRGKEFSVDYARTIHS